MDFFPAFLVHVKMIVLFSVRISDCHAWLPAGSFVPVRFIVDGNIVTSTFGLQKSIYMSRHVTFSFSMANPIHVVIQFNCAIRASFHKVPTVNSWASCGLWWIVTFGIPTQPSDVSSGSRWPLSFLCIFAFGFRFMLNFAVFCIWWKGCFIHWLILTPDPPKSPTQLGGRQCPWYAAFSRLYKII